MIQLKTKAGIKKLLIRTKDDIFYRENDLKHLTMLAKNLKKIAIAASFFLLSAGLVLAFYFFFFYLPLQRNEELFPSVEREKVVFKEIIPKNLKEDYGIYYQELKNKNNIYFIDGREKEEFDALRVKGAIHIRTLDISFDRLISTLGLTPDEFKDVLIVIYCHDGHRGSEAAAKINLPNVKFLIGGRKNFLTIDESMIIGDLLAAPFPDHIKNRNFIISPNKAAALLKEGAFLIDGRLYEEDNLFDSAYKFRIGQMDSKEYFEKLQPLLKLKNNQIIFIANIYPDLFYAKLLIHRLERDYGFNYRNFHIVFGRDAELAQKIQE